MEFKVACNVIESVEIGKIYRLYDATGDIELDFRTIG